METGIVLSNNIKNKLVNDSTKNDFKAPDNDTFTYWKKSWIIIINGKSCR